MINYSVFVKEETFNGKEIFISINNTLIVAMVHLLISERARLLEQKPNCEWLLVVTVTLQYI